MPKLVDTRTPEGFAGFCYDYLPRKGRLPTALLFPFVAVFDGSLIEWALRADLPVYAPHAPDEAG